jgi:hypothetical protein
LGDTAVVHVYTVLLSMTYLPVRIWDRIGSPHPLVCRKRRLNGDPWISGLEFIRFSTSPCMSYEATKWRRSFWWDRISRGPVSQQVWQDKDTSLLKGHERRA